MTAASGRARRAQRPEAHNQPGLPLEPVPDAPAPRGIDPEAPTPCAAPFDGDDWLFSVDWDGSRCLLIVDRAGEVRLQGLTGNLGDRFPELVSGPAAMRPGTVIDGVICLLDGGGRPDLPSLALRMAGAHREPVAFLATDLLAAAGISLLGRTLDERLQRLAAVVPRDSRVQVPGTVEARGVALADAAREQGLSAIVARRRDGAYHPGVASPARLRIDLAGQRDAIVVGGLGTSRTLHLVLAEWVDGRLSFSGTTQVDGPALRWFERAAEDTVEPSIADPHRAGAGVVWVRPRLTATVATAAHATQPRLVALRDDIDPRWCVRRDPVAPPSAAAVTPLRPFSPTVLHALPLDAA